MKRRVGGDSGESGGWAARLAVGIVVLWLGDRGRYWPRKRAILIGAPFFLISTHYKILYCWLFF